MSNFFKKVTSTVSVVAIVASAMSSTLVVNAASSFTPYADALATAGIISKQSSEAGYNLGNNVTRAEMAKIAVNIKGATVKECTGKVFSDVSSKNGDLCGYVEAAAEAGLVNKTAAKFRPMDLVTRAEMLKMLLSAKGIAPTTENMGFKDLGSDASLNGYINAAAKAGIINKGTSFNPNNNASRGEAFKVAANSAGLTTTTSVEDGDDLDLGDLFGDGNTSTGTTSTGTTSTGTTSTGTTTAPVGNVEIALNPASPAAQSVPQSGTVTFGKFDVTAGKADVSVNSIQFSREGLGNRSDFQRVWIEKAGVRVTGRQSVASDNTVLVTFSPAFVVKAGSTEGMDLVATLSGSSTGGQHRFSIAKSADIVSSASVGGTFPLSTATMTTAAYTVTPVAYSAVGSASTYKVGDKSVEVGQFKITNNATDDKNATFKSITLRNDGTGDAAKNLMNLAVYKNGVKVSSAVSFDSKRVTLAVNDTIQFGRTETYYVRGDIDSVSNTTGDTYILTLQNTDDLNVTETTSNFKATVTMSGTAATYSITGGDLIIAKATTVSSSQTIAPGANDVVLLASDIKVAQTVNLQDLSVYFLDNATYSGTMVKVSSVFTSLKLKIGSTVVATVTPSSSSSTGITFDGTYSVGANTTLSILGNVKSTSGLTGNFKINTLDFNNFRVKEYAANGNTVQSSQMVGSVDGIATTVGSASVTLTRNDGISDQSLAVGATTTGLQFVIKANDVSDVTITKIKVGTGAGNVNPSNVTNVQLMIDGAVVSTKSMSSGFADFNDINVKIPKNGSVTAKVVATFSTAIADTQTIKFKVDSIEGRDANSITLDTTTAVSTMSAGPLYTFILAGTATVNLNSSSPNAAILVPTSGTGTTETELARYTFSASNDALQLTDLYLFNTGSADLSARIKSISLYDSTGTNKLAGGSVVGTGVVSFSLGSTSTFVVPKNTSNSVVIVKASFNDITDGNSSGKTVQLAVGSAAASVVNGTTNGVRLVSQATGSAVTTVTLTSAVSRSHLLVRSKPVVAVSGAATLTTHTFTITADANNRVTLTGVTVSLSNPSATGGTFTLYKDQENVGNEVGTGTIAADGTVAFSMFTNTEISAGTSKTFIFKVSNALTTATVNAKRIFKITDLGYQDMTDTNGPVSIGSVSTYTNVGLPTAESTFTY